jgi:hypothetical protein
VVAGTPDEVAARLGERRGEFVIVVGGLPPATEAAAVDAAALAEAAGRLGLPPRSVVELLRAAGVPRRDAYRLVERR